MRNTIISIILVLFCASILAQKINNSETLPKESKFYFIDEISKKSKPKQQYSKLYIDFIKRKLKKENPKSDDKILFALSHMIIDPINKKNIKNLKSKKDDLIFKYYNALLALNIKKNKYVISLLYKCLQKSSSLGYTRFFLLRSLNYVKNKPVSHRQIQTLLERLILSRGVSNRDARVIYRLSCEYKNPLFIISLAEKLRNAKKIDKWYKLMIQGYAQLIHAQRTKGENLNQGNYLKNAEKYLTEAWEINSKRPETAAALINVFMCQKTSTIDDCIKWFKKAINLQFDYYPAYLEISKSIRRKLGKNDELLYDLVFNCLECGRTNTLVPEYGIKILLNMAAEVNDYRWQLVFLRTPIYQKLMQWTSKKVRSSKSEILKNRALTLQALINIYTLNYKNANIIIKRLSPGVFDKEIIKLKKRTNNIVLSWNKPRTMIEMFSGKYGKELINIQKEFLSGEKTNAMFSLTKIIEDEEEEISKKERLFMIDLLARMGISKKAFLYKDLGSSPLNVGLYYKTNPTFIKKLLKLGIDYTITTPDNKRTALMIAARRNAQADLVDAFKNAGANLNLKDKYGWTALQHSIFMNNLPFIKRLLEFTVNTNTIDNTDNPLLLKVLFWKKDKIFNLLRSYGTNIDIYVSRNRTLLMRALEQNLDLDRLKILLDSNLDLERQSSKDWTAIYYAICYYHNPEAVKLLIKKGAEVNTSDRDGNTPLLIAILWAKNPKKIKLLLKHKANINEKNRAGKTPLMVAVISQNSLDYIKILVERGALLNEVDNSKNTAYDWAIKQKKKAIAKYLSKHGALPASSLK